VPVPSLVRMQTETRKASASDYFPYASTRVPFILIKGSSISWAKNKGEKRELLATRGGKILATWPGGWSTDVFEIDDRKLGLEAL
jgi:hypothetical protein